MIDRSMRRRLGAIPWAFFAVVSAAAGTAAADPADAAPSSTGASRSETPAERNDTPEDDADHPSPAAPASTGETRHQPEAPATAPMSTGATRPSPAPQSAPAETLGLVTGEDKSGVTSQAISTPSGAAKIQGMGESFSAQSSTGIGTYSIPFALPDARGAVQPALALSYSSSSGHGVAGVGWDVEVPFIARQTDRGLPNYTDTAQWNPNQDRFVYNGGQELVPICTVSGGACANAIDTEVMPAWAEGWQYFRPRVEGSFLRFFRNAAHTTWRVQDKTGITMEFGTSGGDSSALEADPSASTHVFRWNLAKEWDAHVDGSGNPVNFALFRYTHDGALAYLSDIYDTTPTSAPSATTLSAFAHHTHLTYEARPDPSTSYRRGWATTLAKRLVGVDVTSQTFAKSTRNMVRRYHLAYDDTFHMSELASVELEGRCGGDGTEAAAPAEDGSGLLPSTSCPTLPPAAMGYSHVAPHAIGGGPSKADIKGYEGFDERLIGMGASPPRSIGDERTALFDIDGDALPDVLVTDPGSYGGKHGVYFQGRGGKADFFTASTMAVLGVNGDDAGSIAIQNLNVATLDIDGNGIADLLNMPEPKNYAVYAPTLEGSSWAWKGRAVTAAAGLDPSVNLGEDSPDIHVVDVNGDGLVDVVETNGNQVQTYFALGRYPGGDGAFGTAQWTSGTTAKLSPSPAAHCVPWAGTPVHFSDADVRLADMNGDGLADIVRFRQGEIRYWPGRGNGVWGTGSLDGCKAGDFGSGTDIVMTGSPSYADPSGSGVRFDDVNGDGLDDLVQVRFDGVDIWLNVDGAGWTQNHTMSGTPANPSFAENVQLADVNGSGTRDIVWAAAENYQYMDLTGGVQPGLLVHVSNGIGKTTDVTYASSTSQMLAAAKAGQPWTTTMPIVTQVVTQVTSRDHLDLIGRNPGVYTTNYAYRDPVYDGRQREFRGFKTVTATQDGDANSPTSNTTSTFLLGQCVDEDTTDAIDPCSYAERWRDNVREALKGLPTVTDSFDNAGTHVSTAHTTYRLRTLYTGLDARVVRYAFAAQSDSYGYDVGPFVPATSTVPMTDVERDSAGGTPVVTEPTVDMTLASSAGRVHTVTQTTVDDFGNQTSMVDKGCYEGCSSPDEVITKGMTPTRLPTDTGGWLWRTTESWVEGSMHPTPAAPARRQDHTMTYTPTGDPLTTTAVLDTSATLTRHDPSTNPTGGSTAGTILLSTISYDNPFGNPSSSVGANGRCGSQQTDSDFASFVITDTIQAGAPASAGGCGATALTTHATYDRGFGVVVTTEDLHGEITNVAYDGFARLSSLTKPSGTPGATPTLPSMTVEYLLPTDPTTQPFARIHTRMQDGLSEDDADYIESYSYVDGMGRGIVSLLEADPSAGDGGQWTVSGATTYDAKGAVAKAYLPWFWNGSGGSYDLSAPPKTTYSMQRYDAFGRAIAAYGLDGLIASKTVHHALSTDIWDGADIEPGPHQYTYASAVSDGHGRSVATVERAHFGGVIEAHTTQIAYLPSGPPESITRSRAGSPSVVRWMQYDSLDRMVVNADPNTSTGFNSDPTAATGIMAWRYAYDDAGDLIGVSDARGCGANYAYDTAGRLLSEDYAPCTEEQEPYTTTPEVIYLYDSADPSSPTDLPILTSLLSGRLVSVTSRAAHDVTSYDGRGRVSGVGRQLRRPGVTESTWYVKLMSYDAADRAISETTGLPDSQVNLQGVAVGASSSVITTSYATSGKVKAVSGSYGDLVTHAVHDADGSTLSITYGDIAHTATEFSYDTRRRVKTVQTYRGPPPWTTATGYTASALNQQQLLEDTDFEYDRVDNPTAIRDYRNPAEWPDGAKPRSRRIEVDDLYRVTQITYGDELAGSDAEPWTNPHAVPGAMPSLTFPTRIQNEQFKYDWLGNLASSDDDQHGFWDRSLGGQLNGGTGYGPYQLASAAPAGGTSPSQLQTHYDEAGNLVWMQVARAGACSTGACTSTFAYSWDEVGHLVRTRRWDSATPTTLGPPVTAPWDTLPGGAPDHDATYGYDDGDDRVWTRREGVSPTVDAYIFDSLELRGVEPTSGDLVPTDHQTVVYASAGDTRLAQVRLLDSAPAIGASLYHVLLEIPDHLGGASIVVDQSSSELVEKLTETGFGQRESDLQFARWDGFREAYGFTDKEDDVATGLTYFGKRWLAPSLGRWVSADPLAVHSPGSADLNLYAYVHGRLLSATDPVGLDGTYTDAAGNVEQLTYDEDIVESPPPQVDAPPVSHVLAPPSPVADAQERLGDYTIEAARRADYGRAAASFAGQVILVLPVLAEQTISIPLSSADSAESAGEHAARGYVLDKYGLPGGGSERLDAAIDGTAAVVGGVSYGLGLYENARTVPPYDRGVAYGGAKTSGPTARRLRSEAEGAPCPGCGNDMVSGTETAPSPEHDPALLVHYYRDGGWRLTEAGRHAYADSPGAFNGALCRMCQRRQGADLARLSKAGLRYAEDKKTVDAIQAILFGAGVSQDGDE